MLFIEIFTFLSWLSGYYVGNSLITKLWLISKYLILLDIADWTTNNYNTYWAIPEKKNNRGVNSKQCGISRGWSRKNHVGNFQGSWLVLISLKISDSLGGIAITILWSFLGVKPCFVWNFLSRGKVKNLKIPGSI